MFFQTRFLKRNLGQSVDDGADDRVDGEIDSEDDGRANELQPKARRKQSLEESFGEGRYHAATFEKRSDLPFPLLTPFSIRFLRDMRQTLYSYVIHDTPFYHVFFFVSISILFFSILSHTRRVGM